MKLAEYLKQHEITQSYFGQQLGVTQGMVYQWLTGMRPVAADQCPRIEKLTDGQVRCEDLNDKVDWAFVRASGTQHA